MFVGPAGSIKKSTTIGYAEELLDGLGEQVVQAPQALTPPILIQRLQSSHDSTLHIISGEFSTFIQKAGVAMYEILTDLYDGKKRYDEGTVSRGAVFVDAPLINMIAATTPAWIIGNMTEDVLGGGFASRVIPIHEFQARQRRMYYRKVVKIQDIDSLKEKLINDLDHIANNINGEFKLTEEAEDFMEDWYQRNAETPDGLDRKLTGFYNRRPAHIHKVAMCLHVAYSDELILTKKDFEDAIQVIKDIEPKVAGTFRAVGKNRYIADMDGITAFIKYKKKVSKQEILKAFEASAEPNKLEELLGGLVAIGDVRVEFEDLEAYFVYTGK